MDARRSKRGGFTLVELAIVLVVVGLLIGGILAAQSMMDTTKVQSQIKQLQQFDSAVSNYKLNYNVLPGDADSNGFITDPYNCPAAGSLCGAGYIGSETLNFFPNLSTRGHLQGNYRNTSNLGGIGVGKPFPKAALGKGGVSVISGYNGELLYYLGPIRDDDGITWPFVGCSPNTFCAILYSNTGKGILSPQQALAIDTKLDDGLPATGKVRPLQYNTPLDSTFGSPPLRVDTGGNCVSGSRYYTAGSSSPPTCILSVVSEINP